MIKASIDQSTSLYLLLHLSSSHLFYGRPGGSDDKESACNAEDLGSIPGFKRSTGEGKGYPLQCSCLGNSMNRGVWVHKELDMAKQLTLSLSLPIK